MKLRSVLPTLWQETNHPMQMMRREIDSLFDTWMADFKLPDVAWTGKDFWPRIDVVEAEKEIVITAEMPGVDERNIEVTVAGDRLAIRGEKKSETSETRDKDKVHRVERTYGSFERIMTLPFPIDGDRVQANFKDGVLKLTVAKPVEAQSVTKKIAIGGEKPATAKKAA